MTHALDPPPARGSPAGDAKIVQQDLPSAVTPDSWPFEPAYLWDAPTRLPSLLFTVAVAVLLALARTGMDTFVPKHALSALTLCLPWWALFHGAWPLLGPRRRQLWAHLRRGHWRASLARWSPRVFGPGRLVMATRVAVFALVLSAAQKATLEPTTAHPLLSLALLLMLLQTCVTAWQLRQAVQNNTATPLDVTSNPKNLKLVPLVAAQLPRSLDDLSIASINNDYAEKAGLSFVKDAIIKESPTGPYANLIAVRRVDQTKLWAKQLVEAYQSAEVKQFIEHTFKGALIPAPGVCCGGRAAEPSACGVACGSAVAGCRSPFAGCRSSVSAHSSPFTLSLSKGGTWP